MKIRKINVPLIETALRCDRKVLRESTILRQLLRINEAHKRHERDDLRRSYMWRSVLDYLLSRVALSLQPIWHHLYTSSSSSSPSPSSHPVAYVTSCYKRITLYSVSRKKETKTFFCNTFYKTQAIPMKFGTLFLEWICYKNIKDFPAHLNNVSIAYYLVKLEMFITLVLPLHCPREKLQNLSHLNCSHQIR